MIMYPRIYLASKSPRRQQLLHQLNVQFDLVDIDVDEAPRTGESLEKLVTRLAREKAQAGWRAIQTDGLEHRPVLAADTVVVLDDTVFGKPLDSEHAFEILKQLSGKCHRVLSAVSVCWQEMIQTELNTTVVHFAILRPDQIKDYVETGESLDKAGAYAIQGLAAAFINRIEGSYSGVMGLPLAETHRLLCDWLQ